MITAVVGSGGKTSLIRELTAKYRAEGKKVFVTTSTHMFIEADTLLTDDADTIIHALETTGYAMAGIPDGIKINGVSPATYEAVCAHADIVLVEADGSRHMPLKFPNATEPVIPDNANQIIVVCGLHGLGQKARDCCHRLELVKSCLGIQEDTVITAEHIKKLVKEGYTDSLRKRYPHKQVLVSASHDGSQIQQTIASMLAEL